MSEELFEKYIQGRLSEAESERLKDLLATDPEAGRKLVRYIAEIGLIIDVGVKMERAFSSMVPKRKRVPVVNWSFQELQSSRRHGRRLGALAAAAVVVIGVAV